MSTSTRFMKTEAGRQSVFGTPVTPTFKLPFTGEYTDATEEHISEYDSGTWTPTEISEKVSDFVTFSLNGTMYFELLPVFLSAGFGAITPVGVSAPFAYDGVLSPSAVGAPAAYTFLFGADENIGGTGPAVRIADAYMQSMTLSFNIASKQIAVQSSWFGRSLDDNAGAGHAFAGVNLPPNVGMMKGLLAGLSIKDAASTGGSFATMTAFSCSLLDWSLAINTGLQPRWSGDNNALTYCGIRHEVPSVEFAPAIRTTSSNYALVKGKAGSRTFQELQLVLNGPSSRQAKFNMTGRWSPQFTAHGRLNNEVVMQPTFRAATPHTQTTSPHFFGWELDTTWKHPA